MKRSVIILILFFIITRLYLYLIGIRFDIVPLYWFYQFLDPQHLKSHLAQSLFYFHTQPPGFNFFLGSVLKWANGFELIVFKTIYLVLGLVMVLVLFAMLLKFKIPAALALLLAMFFAISPPVIFFENWLFYTYPITFLLLISSAILYNYFENRTGVSLFLFFLLLTLIVITRSLFHPIWFIIILIGLILFEKKDVKRIVLCASFPFLLIVGIGMKNYLIFNQANLTSWFGMNLIKMTFTVPFEKIIPHINNGELSDIAVIKPFGSPAVYKKFANFDTVTGIPVLDAKYKSTGFINFNHIAYISISEQYQSAAQYLIKKYPGYYGLSVIKAFYAYLRPSSDSVLIRGNNRRKLSGWVSFYENYLLGDIVSRIWQRKFTNRFGQERTMHINFLYFFIPLFYIWGTVLSLRGRKMLDFDRKDTQLLAYFMFNIFYITIIGNFIEISENMRFRFLIVPFTYILIATMLKYFLKKMRLT